MATSLAEPHYRLQYALENTSDLLVRAKDVRIHDLRKCGETKGTLQDDKKCTTIYMTTGSGRDVRSWIKTRDDRVPKKDGSVIKAEIVSQTDVVEHIKTILRKKSIDHSSAEVFINMKPVY